MKHASNIDTVARRIVRDLRARKNAARAAGVQIYFKHAVLALGIDAKTLRSFTREQGAVLKTTWTVSDAVALCDRLLDEPEIEIRMAGVLILNGFRRDFAPTLLPTARRWLTTRLDNWALVDGFCSCVSTPLVERHPSAECALRQWSRHRTLWVRRAALVTLVGLARRGQSLDLAYALATEHFPDSEDLMHKATGWLLREAGKTDQPRLKRFLLTHGPRIPRTALRYAIERFPAAQRVSLLKSTRGQA